MILLDTHVLLWLDEGNLRLGDQAVALINQQFADERVLVSAISFWEVTMLTSKRRVRITKGLEVWRNELLRAGLEEWPLDGLIAIKAGELAGFHGDPADRLIVASAMALGCPLLTADERVLGWKGQLRAVDAQQ